MILPIDFCITIDNSGSMGSGRWSRLQQVKDAANDFVRRRDLSEDKFGVVRFDHTVSKLLGLSDNKNRIVSAINSIGAGGGTEFAGALRESAAVLRESSGSRKRAVLFFTDGENGDKSEALNQARQLGNSGIIICAVATEDADRNYLAKMTGDRNLVIIARGGDIAGAFKQAETVIAGAVRR